VSNLFFPKLRGVGWGASITPHHFFSKQVARSGRSVRALHAGQPVTKISISYSDEGFLDEVAPKASKDGSAVYNDFETMFGFFNYHNAGFQSFLFQGVNAHEQRRFTRHGERQFVGDGATTTFQLVRNIGIWPEAVYWPQSVPEVYVGGVSVAAGFGNLAANPSFALDLSGWINNGFVWWGGPGHNGVAGYCCCPSGSASPCTLASNAVPCAPGDSFYAEAWVFGPGSAGYGAVSISFYDVNGTGLYFPASNQVATPGWQLCSLNVVAPANAVSARVVLEAVGSGGNNISFDDAVLHRTGPGTFSDLGNGQYQLAAAPAQNALVTANFTFAYRCVFDAEEMEFKEWAEGDWHVDTPLTTVKR